MKPFAQYVLETFDELKELFIQKHKQYGDHDPLANFRNGALLKFHEDSAMCMYQIAKDYELKHIAHVYGHDAMDNKVDESLKDIAVYSIIELYLNELAKEEQAEMMSRAIAVSDTYDNK